MRAIKHLFLTSFCICIIASCQPPDPKDNCKQVLADWESFLQKPATTSCDHHGDCVIYGSQTHCNGVGKGVSEMGVTLNKATMPYIKEISDTLIKCKGPFTYVHFSHLEPSEPLCIEGKCTHGSQNCRDRPP